MVYYIKNKFLVVGVDSEGGSLHSIEYLGEQRMWQGGAAWQSRDVAIFPIIGHAGEYTVEGKVYKPRSHGVARYSEFALADLGTDRVTLEISSNPVTRATYPYDFDFSVGYQLKKNAVVVTYTVRSKQGTIPFYVGGHPGMYALGGEAVIEFEREENALRYPIGGGEPEKMEGLKSFKADKAFFAECKTLQLGGLSGGRIYAHTKDGYTYTYKSDCPVFAFWSNEKEGDYICVEPWWGINDSPSAPRELQDKPFINFTDEKGSSFSYTLTIEKS